MFVYGLGLFNVQQVAGLGWAGLLSFLSEALNNLQLPTLLLPISRQFLCLLDNTISRCYL
jgi:hypothetical protein